MDMNILYMEQLLNCSTIQDIFVCLRVAWEIQLEN